MEPVVAECSEEFEDEDMVDACEMGAQRVAGAAREAAAMGESKEEAFEATNYISGDALFANTIAPNIRALAGCEDYGHGTYTDCDEEASWKENELWDAFYDGAAMQIDREYDEYS